MNATENTEVMRGIFSAIEHRDFQRLLDLCSPMSRSSGRRRCPTRGASAGPGPKPGCLCSRPTPSSEWIPASSPPVKTRW